MKDNTQDKSGKKPAPLNQSGDLDRRQALITLGQLALYVSPVTTSLLMGTRATAQSCVQGPNDPPCPPQWP
jgi:hypothetical protein